MNLRNTIKGEKEEENKITFSLDGEKGAEVSYTCDSVSLATFLLNLIDVGEGLIHDEDFPPQWIEDIHKKWKEGIDNLSTKE